MSIEVRCSACGQSLAAENASAGKMLVCPACQQLVPVPETAASSTPAPVLPDSNNWYMRTPEGYTYGPATREQLDHWMREGRVDTSCQLSPDGKGTWKSAGEYFPGLVAAYTPTAKLASQSPPALGVYGERELRPEFDPSNPFQISQQPVNQRAHRGELLLLLGICGVFCCPFTAFIAWLVGRNDLNEMEAGRVDKSGQGLTKAGMIVGAVVSWIWIGIIMVYTLILLGNVVR